MVPREQYLKTLRQLRDHNVIKVITGIRRAGKSTLLAQFRDELKKDGVKSRQIQSYNLEDPEQNEDLDWRHVYQTIADKLIPDAQNYIFIDEIQVIPDFEKLADGLFIKENVDLYITGSNAHLLSGELTTLLTGRYVSIHVLPFSFAEFVQMFPAEPNTDRLLEKYLIESSFPEAVNLSVNAPGAATAYLRDVYDTIVNKDITARYEIRDKMDFERVTKFVFGQIGSPISATNIANALSTNHSGVVYHATVIRYLDYLVQSYVLYKSSRYDIKGKRLLTTNDKYYVVDLGLRRILLGNTPDSDLGHRLENIIFLELVRRYGSNVWVGKNDDREVDFVVQKPNGERAYYQVAYQVNDRPETLRRELAPLKTIRDNYPKYLITTDLVPEEFEGIKKVNAVDWLLGV